MSAGTNRIAALLSCLIALPAFAQAPPRSSSPAAGFPTINDMERSFEISGLVRDSRTFQPLDRIRLTLTRFTGEIVQELLSDGSGSFTFSRVPTGEYSISGYSPGYVEARASVVLRVASVRGIIITMQRQSEGSATVGLQPISVEEASLSGEGRREYKKGMKSFRSGDLEKSRRHFERVAELSPDFGGAHYALGVVAVLKDDRAECEKELRRAIELDPSLVQAHILLGDLLNDSQRFVEAEEILDPAGSRWPDQGLLFYELGRAQLGQKNLAGAETSLRRAHALDEKDLRVHLLFSNVLVAKGDYGGALKEMEHYLVLDPEGALATEVRAKAELLRARVQEQARK